MANTYQLIGSVTVGAGGTSSILFSNIPATYTDLLLLCSLRTNRAGAIEDGAYVTYNGVDGTAGRNIEGDGSSASSKNTVTSYGSNWATRINGSTSTANTFSNNCIYIPNYASSNTKTRSVDGVMETNATTSYVDLDAQANSTLTSAITSISFGANGNFVQHSTVYLYGIKNS